MRRMFFVSVLALFMVASTAMAQHLPHQTPTKFPFRCPQAGICLQTSGKANVFGGVRHGDHEIRFHAIYRPVDKSDPSSDPWCVAISDTQGKRLVAGKGGSGCDDLDQSDTHLFGYKPTISADEGDDDTSDAPSDESDATYGCMQHLAQAELQPDHESAWAAVRALAGKWLNDQDKQDDQDEKPKK